MVIVDKQLVSWEEAQVAARGVFGLEDAGRAYLKACEAEEDDDGLGNFHC